MTLWSVILDSNHTSEMIMWSMTFEDVYFWGEVGWCSDNMKSCSSYYYSAIVRIEQPSQADLALLGLGFAIIS